MTCFRNSAFAAVIGAGALLAGLSAAQAQTTPPQADQATGAPQRLPGMLGPTAPVGSAPPNAANPSQPAGASPAQSSAGSSGGSGIMVSSLGDVEGPPTGTLDSSNGGLGMTLWSGSSRATVEELMSQLPIVTPIASIRALARRIVLTKAALPIGAAPRAFMTVRIQSLLNAGLLSDAADLAAIAVVKNDPIFARVQAKALLFAGQQAHLCDNTTATRLDSAEPFWIELRAYCYAINGNDAALSLTRAVMAAQNIQDDAFDTLLDDVQSHIAKDPGDISAPTALDAFLLQKLGLGIDFDTGAQLGTPGLLLALRNKQNPPEDRMRAAERLLRTGALSPDEMIALADAQHFTAKQFATEHAQVGYLPFLTGQALLRQAVLRASPDAQPALIYEALHGAEAKGLLGIAAVLQQGALLKLQPAPNLRSMVDLFTRALMMTGHDDAAARWMGLLNPDRDADRHLLAKLTVILDLMAPNPSRQAGAKDGLNELAQDVTDKTPDAGFAALALGLSAALHQPMDEDEQKTAAAAMAQHWPGRRPAASIMRRLQAALNVPGKKGEALMLALNAIGPRGPGNMAPDAVVTIIRALVRLGVPGSARDIAITALVRYRAPPPLPKASKVPPVAPPSQ